jgi:prevent-host-death family protein
MEGCRMHVTNISEAKANLSALIEKVVAGEEVIIGKAGKPVAKLVRYERSTEPRRPGALKGKIRIAKDFDELPEDIAAPFGAPTF